MGTSIKVVGTGSSGNSYIIQSGGQAMIIDIGCKFAEIIEYIDDLKKVVGCICDHAHSDHLNKSTAKEFIRRGINVYVGENVYDVNAAEFSELGISCILDREKRVFIGGFCIQNFYAPHNVPNYGFLIETPDMERIVFVTDTTGVNLRFKELDCIMVECNHDDETLLENLDRHEVSMSHPEYHLGLNDCAEFCRQNTSVFTKQIILIHMSHANVNEERAVAMVKERTHFENVAVAHSGDIFTFDNDNF